MTGYQSKRAAAQDKLDDDRHWNIDACKAYAEQLRDKTRANTAEHAAEAIEFLLQVYQDHPAQAKLDDDDTLTIAYATGYYDGKKATQSAQEPVAWLCSPDENGLFELPTTHKACKACFPVYRQSPQPAQEPWRESASDYERGVIDGRQMQAQSSVDKAVNAMTQRPWVDLTDEEIGELIIGTLSADTNPAQTRPRDIKFARSVLATFKEKNT